MVLSSAWRYLILNGAMTLGGFHSLLRTHGVTKDLRIIGNLPEDISQVGGDEGAKQRGRAILNWFSGGYLYPNWVAVDDLELFRPDDYWVSQFVQTDGKVGLTAQDADLIIDRLNMRYEVERP